MDIVERIKESHNGFLLGFAIFPIYDEATNSIVPLDASGFVISRSDIDQVLMRIKRFYDSLAEGELEEINLEAERRRRAPVERQKDARPESGFVYIFRALSPLRMFKIGKARDVEKRRKQQLKLPFKVEQLMSFEVVDHSSLERELH